MVMETLPDTLAGLLTVYRASSNMSWTCTLQAISSRSSNGQETGDSTKTEIPRPEMSVSVVAGAGFEPATFGL